MTASAAAVPALRRVHLVFKTHLDIGFTDLAANVVARYLDHYIPQALDLATALRAAGPDRFVWTTGSWLIWHTLATWRGKKRKRLEDAIAGGDLRWHGLPFTTHTELMDAALFRRGLGISAELDRRFGVKTIAAKMTDVPGHTRAIVPLLAEAGVRLLHFGVNPASRMPVVPPVFRWAAAGAEIIVVYNADYGALAQVPGCDTALAFGFTGDNHGPPGPDKISENFQELRARHPGAMVTGSTLDAFTNDLLAATPAVAALPVVTREIGDTWIHGVGTDPKKLAGFRDLQRLHAELVAGSMPLKAQQQKQVEAFGRALLMVPEHTWGLDIKTHLSRPWDGPAAVAADRRRFRAADFKRALSTARYRRCIASWQEQRNYLTTAVEQLGNSAARRLAQARLRDCLNAKSWSPRGRPKTLRGGHLNNGTWDLTIDTATGAIIGLTALKQGRVWADPDHPLARFRHQTFSAADYARWVDEYIRDLDRHRGWAIPDFTKPGMDIVPARSGFRTAKRGVRIRHFTAAASEVVIIDLTMPAIAIARGCPRAITTTIILPHNPGYQVGIQTIWRGKTATRLPEASWLDFHPAGISAADWRLVKLGHEIDPLDVVAGGGRFLHAVDSVKAGDFALHLTDAALVAPGGPHLLRADEAQPDLSKGISVNLHNNVWGSNFPMWYGEDARFRFRLSLG